MTAPAGASDRGADHGVRHPLRPDLLWLIAIAATSTCVQAARPTASYRTLELGGAATAVGIVAASYALPSILAALPIGLGIDRIGARQTLIGGGTLLIIGSLLCALAPDAKTLAFAQGALGLGQISIVLSVQSFVANRPSPDEGFARLTLAGGAGQLFGPLMAGWLVSLGITESGASGSVIAFVVSSCMAVIALVLFVMGTRHLDLKPGVTAPPLRDTWRILVKTPGLGKALSISATMTSSVEMMVVYLPVLAAGRQISPATVGAVLAVRALSGLGSRVVLVRIMRWLGRIRLLTAALVMAGLAMAGLAASSQVVVWYLLAVVIGFGLGLGAPMTMAIVALSARAGTRASAMAVRITGDRTGTAVLAIALGGLSTALGAGIVFVFTAAALLGGAAWMRVSSNKSVVASDP